MRIGELAERLGTTTHSIRFYERRGLLPAVGRRANGYREYGDEEVTRLRLLMGLRQLDLPLDQAAELAGLCAAGQCNGSPMSCGRSSRTNGGSWRAPWASSASSTGASSISPAGSLPASDREP